MSTVRLGDRIRLSTYEGVADGALNSPLTAIYKVQHEGIVIEHRTSQRFGECVRVEGDVYVEYLNDFDKIEILERAPEAYPNLVAAMRKSLGDYLSAEQSEELARELISRGWHNRGCNCNV